MNKEIEKWKNLTGDLEAALEASKRAIETMVLDEMAEFHAELKDIKDVLESTKKTVNRILEIHNMKFCTALVDTDLDKFTYNGISYFPSAKGYFSIKKDEASLKEAKKFDAQNPELRLFQVQPVKESVNQFAESVLQSGNPLPKFINRHIMAQVRTRKTK